MPARRRLWKALVWLSLVVLASLAGGVWFAYLYATNSETIARLVRQKAPRFLPGSLVNVDKARVRPLAGEVHLTHVSVRQGVDGSLFETVHVPWLSLRCDPQAYWDGRFVPTEVVVAQPTLRLCRRNDGTWNLQGLLANPWPGGTFATPPVRIMKGTVELADPKAPPGAKPEQLLRDVTLTVQAAGPGRLEFDGTAKGDTVDRISLRGTVEVATGRVTLRGDVARLSLTDTLRQRLPADWRAAVESLGLNGGEADLFVNSVSVDPAATPRVRYDVAGRLRSTSLYCKAQMPFPINDLDGSFHARDGVLTVEKVEGHYGTTSVHLDKGRFVVGDPATAPFDVELSVVDLELDAKLRAWTPPAFAKLWTQFRPAGRLNLAVSAGRAEAGGPVRRRVVVDCTDVSLEYENFRYPVDHVHGPVVWEGDRVEVQGLTTLVGGRPLTCTGTIDRPGPGAVVALTFVGQSLPIDQALFRALPPDVRRVVDQFQPTGTVRGSVTVRRTPPSKPGDDPKGRVTVDAFLDLNERCGIRWANLPYPVNSLTGRLEIHPDLWEFQNMRGLNGQAVVTGSGRVQKITAPGPLAGRLKVDLHLNAEKLPFDDQLRDALPPAWQKAWANLDPTGSSDVDATIAVHPGEPDRYTLVVVPRPATDVRLHYSRQPRPGVDPGGTFELRLEDVTGRFVFNNGPVDMQDVGFQFHGAPVQFARGRVVVENSGRFELGVSDLWVRDIRLDARLQRIMPPVMAQFAQKLDDGRTFTLKGNLGLGWSGQPGSPVWCRWGNTRVVFIDNSIQVQPGLALEHMQGQLDHVRGWTDGTTFDLHGALRLESVSLKGQQVLELESPLDVEAGQARLDNLRGSLLRGELSGRLGITLDATPRYAAALALRGADLQEYAKTLPGHQKFRGQVHASVELEGFGSDLRTLQGKGEAHILDGDLGELPVYLQLVKVLTLSPATKTAFDSADVVFRVQNGKTYFDPIGFTGNAFSLKGRGTMDVQGDLGIRLRVLYGRDRMHVRGLSDALREAGGQFLVVRVSGTPSFPKINLEPLPEVTDALKSLRIGQRRGETDPAAPTRR